MSVRKVRYNPVAEAVRIIGGVRKAAKRLGTDVEDVKLWVKRGYVPYRLAAMVLNEFSDVPEEDLLGRGV
jgi:phage host-nuclease inhibitor protein Gam